MQCDTAHSLSAVFRAADAVSATCAHLIHPPADDERRQRNCTQMAADGAGRGHLCSRDSGWKAVGDSSARRPGAWLRAGSEGIGTADARGLTQMGGCAGFGASAPINNCCLLAQAIDAGTLPSACSACICGSIFLCFSRQRRATQTRMELLLRGAYDESRRGCATLRHFDPMDALVSQKRQQLGAAARAAFLDHDNPAGP